MTRPRDLICSENTRAISIDIDYTDDILIFTFCSLLAFDLDGKFNADGLLDSSEQLGLKVDPKGQFSLKGALMFGARLTIRSLTDMDIGKS